MKTMNSNQQRNYNKAMKSMQAVFDSLCNSNGPLFDCRNHSKVWDIIGEAKAKIDKLIEQA